MLHGQAVVKQMGEQPKLSYVVISKGKFEGLVRDILLVKKYRIELYVRPAQSRSNDWEVRCKASPGNLAQFEDMLFDDGGALLSGSSIIAIQLCKNKVSTILLVALFINCSTYCIKLNIKYHRLPNSYAFF